MKRRVALSAVMLFLVFCIISVPLSLIAETAVILKGRTITQGGLDHLVILPDGTVIDSTVLTKGFWKLGFAHDELLVHVLSTHEFLRFNKSPAALLSNLLSKPEIYNLFVYDPAMRKLMKYNDYTVAVGMTSPTIQTVLDGRGTILVLIDDLASSAMPGGFFPDTTRPSITCPLDTTIECDQSPDPAITGIVSATDICDPNVTITFTDTVTPGTCPEESTITRTWTATDDSGNSSSCVQTIEVVDTTSPVIACNAPISIKPPDAPISFTATATDNCDNEPSFEITGYDCFKFTQKGKRIDKTKSCVVSIDGDTIIINDSGGVGDHITWTTRSMDSCGNVAESVCKVEVVNPANP